MHNQPLRSDVDDDDDDNIDNIMLAEGAVKSECVLSILPSVPQAITSIRTMATRLPNTEDPAKSESVSPSFSPFRVELMIPHPFGPRKRNGFHTTLAFSLSKYDFEDKRISA